jgi:hypothetical protein
MDVEALLDKSTMNEIGCGREERDWREGGREGGRERELDV